MGGGLGGFLPTGERDCARNDLDAEDVVRIDSEPVRESDSC